MTAKSYFLNNFLVAIIYYLLSQLVLSLPATGNLAILFWPAAGLALAAHLVFGNYILLGVFLGAFFINIRFVDFSTDVSYFTVLFFPGVISLGAVLHPVIAGNLLKIVGIRIAKLFDYKEIFSFFFIGAVLGAIITSTVGTLTLYYNGTLGIDTFIDNWIAWWIGDILGVFICFPIFYLIFNFKKKLLGRALLVIIPLTLGILISILVHFQVTLTKQDLAKEILTERNEQIFAKIIHDLDNKKIVVESLKSFFESSDDVTREDFFSFTSIYLNKIPEIIGFYWAPKVTADKLTSFNEHLSKIYSRAVSVHRVGDNGHVTTKIENGATLFPVLYAEPFFQISNSLGRDSNFTSMIGNLDIDSLSRSEIFSSFDSIEHDKRGKVSTYKMLLPVFDRKLKVLRGYIICEIDFSKLLSNILERYETRDLLLNIYSFRDDSLTESDLIYSNQKKRSTHKSDIRSSKNLYFGNKRVLVEFVYDKKVIYSKNPISEYSFIIISLFFTGILGVILLLISGQNETISQIVRDRTSEIEKSNQSLEQTAKKISEFSVFKSEFLHIISFEIQTILNETRQYLEQINYSSLDIDLKKNIVAVKENNTNLNLIVKDILDFFEIDSGKVSLKYSNFNVHELIYSLAKEYEGLAKEKGLGFNFKIMVSCPEFIQTDREKLKKILINLLENALKFTRLGQFELFVDAEILQNHMSIIRFVVKDTGIGMNDEELANLFQLSSSLEIKKKNQTSSSGLGLVISSELVRLFGGELTASSIYDKGSEFTFFINAKIVSSLSLSDEDEYFERDFSKLRILVCEDNKVNQKIILAISKKLKLSTDFIDDISKVEDKVLNVKYDAVFMDIQMSNSNGVKVAKGIRATTLNHETPVIALTLNVYEDVRIAAREAGMKDFIEKPIRTIELMRVLKNIIDGKYQS